MPVLTSCVFQRRDFTGAANCNSIPYVAGSWAWVTQTSRDRTASLARVRVDSEIVIPLVQILDTPANRRLVDEDLSSEVRRISGIRAGMVSYSGTALSDKEPNRHPAWRVFIDFSFRILIDLPWYCFPVDNTRATIHYYILIFLDEAGRLRANVDQWEWKLTETTGPFCGGEVANELNSSVPGGVGKLQAELETQLELFSDRIFSDYYFLPGSGQKIGSVIVENVRNDAALILIQ